MAEAPFLEVLTRCCRRPTMLARNQASLDAQTDGDWLQTILIDDLGRGIPWASEQVGRYAPHLVGRYIWLLDDDDECIRPTLVAELRAIVVSDNAPAVIMLKMNHGPRGVLPELEFWGQPPAHGHIGVSAYVVERKLWQAHAAAWSPGAYHSDFNFIASVFASDPRIYWYDVIASQVQQIGLGRPERS